MARSLHTYQCDLRYSRIEGICQLLLYRHYTHPMREDVKQKHFSTPLRETLIGACIQALSSSWRGFGSNVWRATQYDRDTDRSC